MPPRARAAATSPKARKTPAKATTAKAKTASTKATSTKATSASKTAAKRTTSTAPVTPDPVAPKKKQTRTATKKQAVKVKAEPGLIDEEAMEDGEEEDVDDVDDDGDIEERSADNTNSGDESDIEEFIPEDSAEPEEEQEILVPQTPKVKRIMRSHSEATSPPSSQKSPSPVKKAVTFKATQPKSTKITRKLTPAKPAKRDRSDDEYVDDEDASPTKKNRQASPTPESEVEEVVPKTKKATRELPRRQTVKGKAEATKATSQKVQRTPSKARTTTKSSVKAKAAKNVPESTGSANVFFGDEQMSDEERKRRTRLFSQSISTTDFDDVKDTLLEIEEAAASVGPKDTTSTFGDGAATTAVEDGVTTIDNVQSPVQEFAVQPDDSMDVDILDLDVEGAVDPVLRDSYKSLPHLKPCTGNYGGYNIQTLLLSEGVLDQPHFQINKRAIINLVTQFYDPKVDDPFVISPSRVNPAKIVADTKFNAKNKVLSLKTASGAKRLINFAVGLVLSCNIHEVAPFPGNKSVKQVLLVPLRGEWERALGLYGMTFGVESVVINTFGVPLVNADRVHGLSFRTFPVGGETQATKHALPGMGFTPRKSTARTQASKSSGGNSATGRTLLEMTDKTAWSASDDIPLLDGREYFKANKLVGNIFKHEIIHTLPGFKTDLEFGDLALVYYSVSSFGGTVQTEMGLEASLSLNLYGAVLLAKGS